MTKKLSTFEEMRQKLDKLDQNDASIWGHVFGKDIITSGDAWEFLQFHPRPVDDENFERFDKLTLREKNGLDFRGQFTTNLYINIDDDTVYLETGPAYYENQFPDIFEGWRGNMHDIRLDTSAATFEAAIIELAKKVREYYGDY